MAVADQISKRAAKGKPRGRPFAKGMSGNPGGRPRGIRDRRMLRTELLELLDEAADDGAGTKLRRLVEAIVAQGIRGNVQAFKVICDTVDGRPMSMVEMEAQDRAQENAEVTVNILEVLGTLPDEALRKLREAAEAKEAALRLPEARRLP